MQIVFDKEYVNKFWKEKSYEYSLLMKQMEEKEHWVISSNKDIKLNLFLLQQSILQWPKEVIIKETDSLIEIFTYFSTSQVSYIMYCLEQKYPDITATIIIENIDKLDINSNLFIQRFRIISESKLLGYIVSKEQINFINSLLTIDLKSI